MISSTPLSGSAASRVRDFARTLVDIVLPSQCAGCGTWDEVLCAECDALAQGPAQVGLFDPDGEDAIPLVHLGAYDGELRRILISAKHSPAFGAEDFLDRAGETLGRAFGDELARPLRANTGVRASNEAAEEWWVVPAPASWRRRLFGRNVTTGLAAGVARGLAEATGSGARVVDAIAPRLAARSQAGRGGRGRRDRRAGSMRARLPLPDPSRILLVDDVLTTGATARELRRVCGGAAGIVVLARVAAPSL